MNNQNLSQFSSRPTISYANRPISQKKPKFNYLRCLFFFLLIFFFVLFSLSFFKQKSKISQSKNIKSLIKLFFLKDKHAKFDILNKNSKKKFESGLVSEKKEKKWIKLENLKNIDNITTMEIYLNEEIDKQLKNYDPKNFSILNPLFKQFKENIKNVQQEETIQVVLAKLKEYDVHKQGVNEKYSNGIGFLNS